MNIDPIARWAQASPLAPYLFLSLALGLIFVPIAFVFRMAFGAAPPAPRSVRAPRQEEGEP